NTYGVSVVFLFININSINPITTDPIIAKGISPAPTMIPVVIDQNKYTKSKGSLTTVLKRTMDKAPTIPNEVIKFEDTARITKVVIMSIPINVIPNDEEY